MRIKLPMMMIGIVISLQCKTRKEQHSALFYSNLTKEYAMKDASLLANKDMGRDMYVYVLGLQPEQLLTDSQKVIIRKKYNLQVENLIDTPTNVFLFISRYNNTVLATLDSIEPGAWNDFNYDIVCFVRQNLIRINKMDSNTKYCGTYTYQMKRSLGK